MQETAENPSKEPVNEECNKPSVNPDEEVCFLFHHSKLLSNEDLSHYILINCTGLF